MIAAQQTSDWAIVGLTGVLVLITAYYAWTNRTAVAEMAEARRQAVMPKLAITLDPFGPTYSKVKLLNVGQGAALDINVELLFEVDGQGGYPGDRRHWRRHVVAPREAADFDVPDSPSGGLMDNEQLVKTFRRVRLTGQMKDVLGATHVVDETIDRLDEWLDMLNHSGQYIPHDWLEEIAKTLRKMAK